ncbi:hypothetical protein SHIRM173S_07958 [Streptomyces hirsutus]
MSASTTTVTPSSPAEVICSVLAPTASRRFLAMSLIWWSVTWKGLLSSQMRSSSMPSWIWSERVSMFSMTCQVTNQPMRPMTTNPNSAVSAVAGPRGSPVFRSRATVGWSSAVISSAEAKASTTSCTAPMTRMSTQTVPASTSRRQPASAATRTPQGTACAGSGREGATVTGAGAVPKAVAGAGSAAGAWSPGGTGTRSAGSAEGVEAAEASGASGPAAGAGVTPGSGPSRLSRSIAARRSSNRLLTSVSPAPIRPSHPGTCDMVRPFPRFSSSLPLLPPGASIRPYRAKAPHRRTVRGSAEVERGWYRAGL